jgi:phenylacetic acid degradation operon negative regulatory protein
MGLQGTNKKMESKEKTRSSGPELALERIVAHLKSAPSRTWSVIITFYGDAIVPRGGSVWLGTLLAFLTALDIDEGAVRTAMSRLAADGWIERTKVGRNSFYRLAEKGLGTFRAATEHIYFARPPAWKGRFDLLLNETGAARDLLRNELAPLGYGAALPGVWLAPQGENPPQIGATALRLSAETDVETARKLAAQAWPLAEIGEAYRRFNALFTPLDAALTHTETLSPIDALVARILLIHEYRRVILRDPILPEAVLPEHWPGTPARQLCAALYAKLLAASELWLEEHMLNEEGVAPKPAAEFYGRFRA